MSRPDRVDWEYVPLPLLLVTIVGYSLLFAQSIKGA